MVKIQKMKHQNLHSYFFIVSHQVHLLTICFSLSFTRDKMFCSFLDFHTISSTQAMLLPVGASCSLLFMFFFFEKFQSVFALCTVGMFKN